MRETLENIIEEDGDEDDEAMDEDNEGSDDVYSEDGTHDDDCELEGDAVRKTDGAECFSTVCSGKAQEAHHNPACVGLMTFCQIDDLALSVPF